MVVCSGFPTQILLAILVRAAGVPDVASDGQISLPFVALVSLADTALLIGLMLWFLQSSGQTGTSALARQPADRCRRSFAACC